MPNDTVVKLIQPGTFNDQLTDVLRNGARALLAQAVEAEVSDFLGTHADLKTEDGHRRVVRHGHLPEREVMTGIGPVAVRQPRNAVGWVFLAIGLFVAIALASGEYANYTFVVEPGSLPGGIVAGWFHLWTWLPGVMLVMFLPLLFPNGRVPGRRWRPVLWALVAVMVVFTATAWFFPGPMQARDKATGKPAWPDNPLGVHVRVGLAGNVVVFILVVVLLAASLAAMIVRFRRSRGEERQQLKWMLFAVIVLAVTVAVPAAIGVNFGDFVFAASVALLPAAVAVAMFKYRLYDVDRVISKTLVYGTLTVILAGAYVGLVLAGQWVFSSFAGGSNLTIAASTLVVAALFLPVRSRVQRFVDRRFYRRRYDAQRTLEAFGSRLREQVELEQLQEDLRGVVSETMQPAHASLWLRRVPSR